MKSIKFSHEYNKFPPDDDPSILLGVFTVPVRSLSESFILYDTTTTDGSRYSLPKSGDVLVLLLYQECNNHLWTTVRRQTPEKERYYRSLIGQLLRMDYPGGSP